MKAATNKIKSQYDLILKKGVPVDRFGFPMDSELKYWIQMFNSSLLLGDYTYIPRTVKNFNQRQDKILIKKGGDRRF